MWYVPLNSQTTTESLLVPMYIYIYHIEVSVLDEYRKGFHLYLITSSKIDLADSNKNFLCK